MKSQLKWLSAFLLAYFLVPIATPAAPVKAQSKPAESRTIVQAGTAVITDVQVSETSEGLSVVLLSEQLLESGTSSVTGNALTIRLPNATLALLDPEVAQQFAPAEGIALVQVSSSADGGVEVSITGTDAPPTAQLSAGDTGLVLSVMLGDAVAQTETADSIQLVVTATRTEENVLDVPRSVTVIERSQIEQQSTLSNSLPDILGELVPGLSPPPLQSTTRGFTLRGRNIQVLVDGVPQGANASAQQSLNGISTNSIERIEVVPGASAIYGDGATGGIINIITRAPIDEGIVYDLSTGTQVGLTNIQEDSFSYIFQGGVAAADERADGRLAFTYEAENARFDASGDRIPPTSLNDTNRLGLLAKLGYDLTEQQRLDFTYSLDRRDPETVFGTDLSIFDIPGTQTARAVRVGRFDYEREPEFVNQILNLSYRHTDLLGSQLDAQLYYRDEESVTDFNDLRSRGFPAFFPEVFQSFNDFSELGGRLQIDTPLGDAASLLWGVDYASETNEIAAAFIDPAALDNSRAVNVIDTFSLFPRYELDSLGLFAQTQWDITEQWQISGGLRYDNFDFSVGDYQLAFQSPRERQGGSGSADDVSFNAGILYRPIPEIGLFANYAEGFSIPNLGSAFSGNTSTFNISQDLTFEPQTVSGFELGARAEFRQLQASVAGFYNESDLGSFIRLNQATGRSELLRAPQRNYGLEATVAWQPSDTWQLGSYFSWSEAESDTNNDGDFLPLGSLNVPPYKLGVYVENETTPRWSNRLQMLLVGDRDRAVNEGVDSFSINSYATLDLISSLQVGDGQLTMGIENLLNTDYLPLTSQERVGRFEERRFAPPGITMSLRYSVSF